MGNGFLEKIISYISELYGDVFGRYGRRNIGNRDGIRLFVDG